MNNPELIQLVIWGAGGHALVVADIVRQQGKFQIIGFLDDTNPERRGGHFVGASILGGREQIDHLIEAGVSRCILAFGDCRKRKVLAEYLHARGFSFATAMHPNTVVANDITIGAGTVLMAGVVINPGVQIGENVIINTCASIDHECIVGHAAHIAPGVHLAGRVEVGAMATVGIGSVVAARVKIGEGAVIGAGSVVLQDIAPWAVAYGVPASVVRYAERGQGDGSFE